VISKYRPLIELAARQARIDPTLLEAIVWQESSDDPWAFRYESGFFRSLVRDNPQARAREFGPLAACSYGLTQLLYETACEAGFDGPPEDLFDPAQNLSAGAKHLRTLLDWAEGDEAKACGAYNAGRGGWASEAGRRYSAGVQRWKGMLT
jgi:soluble lytic murein transglycosylase-like protein